MRTDRYKPARVVVLGPFVSLMLLVAALALVGFMAGEEPVSINWQAGDGARHYH